MIFCRLDYWLISNTLHDLVKITDIIPSIKTDHAAISLELVNDSNNIKGPGLWKMNCPILDDEDYVNDITEKIPIGHFRVHLHSKARLSAKSLL